MPVPASIAALSQTAASNSPPGSESPTSADDYFRAHASFIATLRDGKGLSAEVDVASGATCDIGAANSQFVRITGTTGITSFGTAYNGPRFIRFAGALTLTHNAASLILPGAANITTVAGDSAIVVPLAAGWQVVSYQRAASLALIGNGPAFSAVQSIAQVVATGANVKVMANTEEYDTANAYDAVTNYRFQPTVSGYYSLNGGVTLTGSPVTFLSAIFKNGVEYKRGVLFGVAGSGAMSTVSCDVFLNGSTDYVELYVFHGTGSSLNTVASVSQTYFQGHLARNA